MAVASLAVTKTYLDGQSLTEAKLDAAFQSIQTYSQSSHVNNFNQLRKDAFGSSTTNYDFDNDGSNNLSNPLINKQSASITFKASDVALNRTATTPWTLTTASFNLRVVPEVVGKYIVGYEFNVSKKFSGAGNLYSSYAIFNKTTNATICVKTNLLNTAGAQNGITSIHISRLINFASTAVATFALYYKNVLAPSNCASHLIYHSPGINEFTYGYIYKI